MPLQMDRAVFVHVPKTGGNFVRSYLEAAKIPFKETGQAFGHAPLTEKNHGFSFCFVRHPLTWYRSFWAYKRRVGLRPGQVLDPLIERSDEFNEFLVLVVENTDGYMSDFYKRLAYKCNFVGRFENLTDDLNTALTLAGFNVDENLLYSLPPANTSPNSEQCHIDIANQLLVVESEAVKRYSYDYIPEGLTYE